MVRKEINFINRDFDKNGNIIKDLSKLFVPRQMQIDLLNRINKRNSIEAGGKNEC